jgi:uncharacterized membrane protein YbaN (DUF454 family)
MTVPETLTLVPVTGWRRTLYKGVGWTSLGVGAVGVVLPGLPTAPFVILSGYFFVRASPELHDWLLRSRWFGGFLTDWEVHRGVRPGVKGTAITVMVCGVVATIVLVQPSPLFLAGLLALEAIGLTVILRLPVVTGPQAQIVPALPSPALLPASNNGPVAAPPRAQRAEQIVDRVAAQVGGLASFLGRALGRAASSVRATSQDVWAEAQRVRRGQRP